jgi:predicted dehydrogenase
MRTTRVAIVGCGQIADAHLLQLRRIANADIVAVCDQYHDLAHQAAARFRVRDAFDDLAVTLAKTRPDVAHVTTPPDTHHSIVLQCLQAGVHVYVEKPFALDVLEARHLVDVAESRGLQICLGHDQLFDPAWQTCRAMVERRELGDIVHIESIQGYDLAGSFGAVFSTDPCHWVHQLPGGLFQNVMSHALARITDLMDDPAPRVHARWFSRSPGASFPSDLTVLLAGDRTSATLIFSSVMRPVQTIARVFGTKSSIEVDLDARTVTRYASATFPGPLVKIELAWRRASQAIANLAENVCRISRADLHYFEGMRCLFERFYESIETGTEPPVSHRSALRTTSIMDDIFSQCRRDDPRLTSWPVLAMREARM